MKKKETLILGGILLVILGIWGVAELSRASKTQQPTATPNPTEVAITPDPTSQTQQLVSVYYQNELVQTFDSQIDAEYWFDGSYGKLKVEVLDGQWRVTEEECPNHICSSIGWVSFDYYFPIICLPNEIAVVIE
ncbi:MAG: NusG domain II-containing protein [Anaerorhabdus sp.]